MEETAGWSADAMSSTAAASWETKEEGRKLRQDAIKATRGPTVSSWCVQDSSDGTRCILVAEAPVEESSTREGERPRQ